ncbi:MAG: hypothetical protein KY475_08220 [Planctomycetes bacterium]|nr:hypothetical protein [Planctomycetota bacterium]
MSLIARPLGADPASPSPESASSPAAIIRVPLPIVGTVDTRLKQTVEQALEDLPQDGDRPTLVLEFSPKEGQAGEASEFERSLSVARFLAGGRLSGVRTVAWLPRSVKGHAVLAVMACEEIAMHPDAELGAAGVHEAHLDPTVRRGYAEIASRRRTLPEAVALGMLDPALAVYRVQTLEGEQYLLDDELETLQQRVAAGESDTVINGVDTVFQQSEVGVLSGREMRLTHHFASHLAPDRLQLAEELGLAPGSLEEDPSLGQGWRAARVELRGAIDRHVVNRLQRAIADERRRRNINFLCVEIESAGGDAAEGLRLANFLADLNSSEVRTVAYIPHEARGSAALVALACDHVVMHEDAVLGGPGAGSDGVTSSDLRAPVEQLAQAKGRDWSLMMAAVDPQFRVYRYTREDTGRVRYFSEAELEQRPQPDDWRRGSEVVNESGFEGARAQELGLARYLAANFDEFRQIYQLEDNPQLLKPNWAHTLIAALADPRWAGVLLFIACFSLMTEMMAPGMGVPGFLSAVCFTLFFWSQFLHGTAGWLEVALFVLGLSCIALELFVLPGTGVFGIGGGALVILSVVLASQTFVIPQTSAELEQIPRSLMRVGLGGLGFFAALVIMRRVLPRTPVFRRLVLEPPSVEDAEDLEHRESLVELVHLVGKRGVTLTHLVPAGKARFGDEMVNVLSRSGMIDAGTPVLVVEVTGNRVMVEPIA